MFAVQRPTLTILFVVMAGPAWSEPYTLAFPNGTRQTIDISNQSADPDYQFTPNDITQILNALVKLPPVQVAEVTFVQAIPSPRSDGLYSLAGVAGGGIQIGLPTPAARNSLSPLSFDEYIAYSMGEIVYQNLNAQAKADWINLNPVGPQTTMTEFYYEPWATNSYSNLTNAIATLQNSGNSTPVADFLFVASLFTDPQAGIITTYTEDTTASPRVTTPASDYLTWSANSITLGPVKNPAFKFFLNVNNQVTGVQIGNSAVVRINPPLTLTATTVNQFAPSETVQTRNPAQQIIIRETADQNYRFTPIEMAQVEAILKSLSPSLLRGVNAVQTQPYTSRPANAPSDENCPLSSGAITCYLSPIQLRQTSEAIDMNAELTRTLGNNLYTNAMTQAASQEWKSLWTWDVSGGAQSSFVILFQQWALDSADALSQAYNAAQNGNTLLFQIEMFVSSYFFDPGSNTASFGSLDQNGLLSVQQLPETWIGSTITIGSDTFQVQLDQNSNDASFGQYQVISIQQAGQNPIDVSQNPFTVPNTFVAALRQVVTTSPSGAFVGTYATVWQCSGVDGAHILTNCPSFLANVSTAGFRTPSSASYTGPGNNAGISTSVVTNAITDRGVFDQYSQTTVTAGGPSVGAVRTNVYSSLYDTITVNDPGFAGEPGSLIFSLALTATGNGTGTYVNGVETNSLLYAYAGLASNFGNIGLSTYTANGVQLSTTYSGPSLKFIFGEPFDVQFEVVAASQAVCQNATACAAWSTGPVFIDASHGSFLQGISVFDQNGIPISNSGWTITDTSGLTYPLVVPSPSNSSRSSGK